MKVQLTKKREVFNFCKPYIIAEIGSNHNGDMDLAIQLIRAAKDAGADCVKFQSWTKDSIFSKGVYSENRALEKDVEEFSISEQSLKTMMDFSNKIGIDCTSTPFSKKEADFLADSLRPPFIKVASMDLNNYPFLEHIAKKGLPMVLATGLSELHEVDRAIRTIERAGNQQIIILHCIANYPPKDEEVNLNNIETLQKCFPYPIGFSDHTIGYALPLAAVAKGACIIEKHFTLDKDMSGWDHKISANVEELSVICRESKRINTALGSFRVACEEGEDRKAAFRRSIVAVGNLKMGEVIRECDIDFKRPGSGIGPDEASYVVGRMVKRDISADALISWADLQ